MEKLNAEADWYLFDPLDAPLLANLHGDQFSRAYEEYVRTVKTSVRVPAVELWKSVCDSQVESGTPFCMYQDNVNSTSCSSASYISLQGSH